MTEDQKKVYVSPTLTLRTDVIPTVDPDRGVDLGDFENTKFMAESLRIILKGQDTAWAKGYSTLT